MHYLENESILCFFLLLLVRDSGTRHVGLDLAPSSMRNRDECLLEKSICLFLGYVAWLLVIAFNSNLGRV